MPEEKITKHERYNKKRPPVNYRLYPPTLESLKEAAGDKETTIQRLTESIVQEWLIRNHYLDLLTIREYEINK